MTGPRSIYTSTRDIFVIHQDAGKNIDGGFLLLSLYLMVAMITGPEVSFHSFGETE